jgi:hypothetical protein
MTMRLLLSLLLATATVAPAYADPDADGQLDTTPLARRLFTEGVDAARRLDWMVAMEKFNKSYELSPRPLTLYNLAGAQVATNRYVRGIESYRKFLRDTSDGTYPEFRKEAQNVLSTLEPKIAWAKLAVTGMVSGDTMALDSEPLVSAAIGESLPIDPGQHVLEIKRKTPGAEVSVVARKEFTLTEGGSKTITLEAPAPPPPPVDTQVTGTSPITNPQHPETPVVHEHHWYTSPLVWGAVVGGAVAIGGGTYLYLHSQPYSSSISAIDVHGSNAP